MALVRCVVCLLETKQKRLSSLLNLFECTLAALLQNLRSLSLTVNKTAKVALL